MSMRKQIVAILAFGLCVAYVQGNVNLELRPVQQTAWLGDVVEVGLYAVSDDETDQMVRGMQVILQWDPVFLRLDEAQPLVNNGPYTWLLSGFFDDSGADGLNDTWEDGNGYYQAAGNFESPAWATPEGLLVTTFRFNALNPTLATEITILPTLGEYTVTEVFGEQVGEDVVGTLGTTTITVESWGAFTVEIQGEMCGVEPGETVTVLVTVSGLVRPINGVQMLVEFDDTVLDFSGAMAGDGAGSPWDSATVAFEEVEGGVLTYALVLLGGESDQNAVVARLDFVFQPDVVPSVGIVQLLTQMPPLLTKFTASGTAITVIPELGEPVTIASPGDLDFDEDVDLADLAMLLSNYGTTSGAVYEDGDMDCDGDVDLSDLAALLAVYG